VIVIFSYYITKKILYKLVNITLPKFRSAVLKYLDDIDVDKHILLIENISNNLIRKNVYISQIPIINIITCIYYFLLVSKLDKRINYINNLIIKYDDISKLINNAMIDVVNKYTNDNIFIDNPDIVYNEIHSNHKDIDNNDIVI
jgi:hypothetical protein